MLTRLVAEKFTDHRGIDSAEIVSQRKELVGHTATSLGQAYQKVFFSKCQRRCLSARQREEEVSCWRRTQGSSNFTLKGKAAEFGANVDLWSWDNLLVLNLYGISFCLETEEEKICFEFYFTTYIMPDTLQLYNILCWRFFLIAVDRDAFPYGATLDLKERF